MALELVGIENVGEFYSGHYLTAVLEGDLKRIFETWKKAKEDDGKRPPHETLAGLSNRFFTTAAKAEEEDDELTRLDLARGFHAHLLEALGYDRSPAVELLDREEVVPVHLSLPRDGNPFLWVIDAPFPAHEDDDPLAASPLREQLPAESAGAPLPRSSENRGKRASWREILDERLFLIDRPPRWVLLLAGREALLIERTKWPQGKYLRFDLGELFGRKQASAVRAMAGLLHRDVLAPDAGVCLHDTLDENSHKHAYAVSGDLKHGVRRSVELLANEAIWYRREKQKLGVFNEEELAPKLTAECLTWLYRLLFLFYVEARGGELGFVPMRSNAYRKGYSLESLRDLELVPLTTDHAQNGGFINKSLNILFRMLDGGFPEGQYELAEENQLADDIDIRALKSPLFDDDRLDILKGVKFRNHVLQEVLQLLSLSTEKKRKTRGRISYAQLGINQLGAVYEGLLSYTGFFATEDMYEVASEKDCKQLSGKPAAEREALKTYFVPASRIGDYKESEIVRDENDRKVVHKKGIFIFRLAGRNREKSASYYTPEVLTKCLVKYALKELLWEEGEEGEEPKRKKTADEILELTICEPAMGSSAFLIEAVDQLADAYLEARQEERGEAIPPEDYQREKRRVKARLATNNCYGVDLNPTAVELAKVSLWLATLHEGGKCPWFGLRLATGNSLVGARREVFKTADVARKGTKDNPNWLGLVPEPVSFYHGEDGPPLDEHWTPPPRPKGTIYHFLLPAEGMAAFDKDKVIKALAPESVKRIKEWRNEFCEPFNKKDAERLEQISDAVDRLFAQVVRERVLATQETSDRIPVWPEPPSANQADLLVRDQEEVAATLKKGNSAYRRLKLAMDAWCALWFWPIEEAGLLPDRATWIAQLELILKGRVTYEPNQEQGNLFAVSTSAYQDEVRASQGEGLKVQPPHETDAERLKRLRALSVMFGKRRADYFAECGLADIDSLLNGDATLRSVQVIADQLHFHHWELRFAEVFAEGGGFDLTLGNPPWVHLEWKADLVFSEFFPLREIKGFSTLTRVQEALAHPDRRQIFISELIAQQGMMSFLGSAQQFPLLQGQHSDTYRAFIVRCWNLGSLKGVVGLIHPESVYQDPKAGALRFEAYPRLRLHAQFRNEKKLFPEVGNQKEFSLNVYEASPGSVTRFYLISNLLHPSTLAESFSHDGYGPVPEIKSSDGNWELRGHRSRLIRVGDEDLQMLGRLYETEAESLRASRLVAVQSSEILKVVRKFSEQRVKLSSASERYYCCSGWGESSAQDDGTIKRETKVAGSLVEWIISGPHIFVGNPLAKTPNADCSSHRDYCELDVSNCDEHFLPRTNFVRQCSVKEYQEREYKRQGRRSSECYRLLLRRRLNPVAERTLIGVIIPPGPTHIHAITSLVFSDLSEMTLVAGMCCSVIFDFFIRATGRIELSPSVIGHFALPLVEPALGRSIRWRALRLNAVIEPYAELWSEIHEDPWQEETLTTGDSRIAWSRTPGSVWSSRTAFRSDLERRRALVELDVLTAIALGLGVRDLETIYRVQFPVLRQYELERIYDQHSRIVPTSKTSSGNPAVSLVELAATLKEQAGFDVHEEYYPDGSNTQELRKQKVRLGKKEADVLGVSERCTMADLLAETEVRWSDQDHPEGRSVRLVGLRYTDPGLEPRMERVYPTPWTRCDREADYRQAWAEFERRLGKKMPEGTPL